MPGSLKKVKQLGFTLVEMLVVISILAIIGVGLFPNLRNFNTDQEFRNQVASMTQSIRTAQTNSQAKIMCPNNPYQSTSTWVFTVFTNSSLYKIQGVCSDGTLPTMPDYQISSVAVVISGKAGSGPVTTVNCRSGTATNIQFNNYNNSIEFNNVDPTDQSCNNLLKTFDELYLDITKGGTTYRITVNKGGGVSATF
jgi:prepilin-type N-terminal cleavage/methylation domain-containing protein